MTQSRRLAAIMFTDIVGFTALMGRDEKGALELLDKNRALLQPIINQFHGDWLKEIGDGTLSSFQSTVDAVNCALAIQQVLKDDPDLKLRIGIHIGDVVFENGDVYGDGVNVASRLEPMAEPGGILVSEKVYDDIRNKSRIATVFIGGRTLKGVDKPVKVYSIITGGTPVKKPISSRRAALSDNRRGWGLIASTAAIIVMLVLYRTGMLGNNPADFTPRLGERSVAVLPFTNLSESREAEFFRY